MLAMLLTWAGYIGLGIAAVLLLLDLARFRKTEGKVLGWERSDGDEGPNASHAPRIRYRTAIGMTREFRSCVFVWTKPLPLVGSMMPVRYHPTIPWLHGVDRWTHRWIAPVFFGLTGAAFVWFGSL
ncbi:DUF3592 domain-containing protein [Phycisphaeraceae bacterium D3-23]